MCLARSLWEHHLWQKLFSLKIDTARCPTSFWLSSAFVSPPPVKAKSSDIIHAAFSKHAINTWPFCAATPTLSSWVLELWCWSNILISPWHSGKHIRPLSSCLEFVCLASWFIMQHPSQVSTRSATSCTTLELTSINEEAVPLSMMASIVYLCFVPQEDNFGSNPRKRRCSIMMKSLPRPSYHCGWRWTWVTCCWYQAHVFVHW